MPAADYEIFYYLYSSHSPSRGGQMMMVDPSYPDYKFVYVQARDRHELLGRGLTPKEAAARVNQRDLFLVGKKSFGTMVMVDVVAKPAAVKKAAARAATAERDRLREEVP